MILHQKPHLDPQLKEELKQYVYDIIGYAMYVCKQLPCGQPEYLYQEAFAKTLRKNGMSSESNVQARLSIAESRWPKTKSTASTHTKSINTIHSLMVN